MSTSKHMTAICVAAVIFAVIFTCAVFVAGTAGAFGAGQGKMLGYEDAIFDTSKVHEIDIVMDDWDEFIETCTSEEYSPCSITIDGETYNTVGIRGKGNTSLSTVASLDSQRYSFKVEFDQYSSGVSYHGLDKLSLNNTIQDTTYMKDYLVYRAMAAFGVDTPLCSYAWITVNGEDWGLYLVVEGVEESFLQRNYGSDYGDLYKPDSMSFGGGRGNGAGFDMDKFEFDENGDLVMNEDGADGESDGSTESASDASSMPAPSTEEKSNVMESADGASGESSGDAESSDASADSQMPSFGGGAPPSSDSEGSKQSFGGNMPNSNGEMPSFSGEAPDTNGERPEFNGDKPGFGGGMPGFGGMGADDVKLKYIDDELDSYKNIFDNAKTSVSNADKKRLISSLKQLSSYENLDEIVNVEEVIRYFVVHDFVCNGDSYTGSMVHNYYLYEEDGQLSMIPWDYNLAFGTFRSSEDATSTVNEPIDTPVTDGDVDGRPMVGWIFSDEQYTERYHELYASFLDEVDMQALVNETAELIAPYVQKDPNAFYSYEEFQSGVEAMKSFCSLRSESVSGQLDGTIPSTKDGQTADSSNLVDGFALAISDMGSMGGQGGMGGPGQGFPGGGGPGGERPKRGGPGQGWPGKSGPSQSGESASKVSSGSETTT